MITMKLWLLRPLEEVLDRSEDNPWDPWFDKSFGFVVRAADQVEARDLAQKNATSETGEEWLDANYSSCQELETDGPSVIILEDFKSA